MAAYVSLCSSFLPLQPLSSSTSLYCRRRFGGEELIDRNGRRWRYLSAHRSHHHQRKEVRIACRAQKDSGKQPQQQQFLILEEGLQQRLLQQIVLWSAEAAYILWLFILPYAPGDPIWAIKPETVNALVGLSLNFLFILPFSNAVGIHVIESPVLHPVSEGLFNFVIGWTLMFAPLIYTDCRRDRYRGSLDLLWGLQMFLTNTFLIPYMAIRLNVDDSSSAPRKLSKLGSIMTAGAPIVGLIGGAVCLLSGWWAFSGRWDGGFGSLVDRCEYFSRYIGSERLAYAFIWDICLYSIFQPWLIGDNLCVRAIIVLNSNYFHHGSFDSSNSTSQCHLLLQHIHHHRFSSRTHSGKKTSQPLLALCAFQISFKNSHLNMRHN